MTGASVPVGAAGLPEGGIVVVDGIVGLEPLVVVARGGGLGSQCEVGLLAAERAQSPGGLSIVGGHYGQDVALVVELQLVDAHLAVEAMH